MNHPYDDHNHIIIIILRVTENFIIVLQATAGVACNEQT